MNLKFIFIKYVIFSLFFIYFVHFLFNYFKNILTPKKTKDLIGFQMKKYNEIINELINEKNTKENGTNTNYINNEIDYSKVEKEIEYFIDNEIN